MLCNIDVSLFSHFILIGDFNVDVVSPNRPLFSKLMNITSSCLLSQIVTEPTHFSHAGVPSIIDLAFVSSPTNVIACNTISPLSTSDHMGISISYKMPSANKRPRSSQREVWCYSLGDFEKACEMLEEINWECIIDKTDVDVSWRNWQSTFLSVVNDCVPRKTLPHRKHVAWITPNILRAIKHQNSLLKAYKRTSSLHKLSQYRQARNQIVSELRKAKLSFFRRIQDSDSKTFWKLFKLLTKKESSIPALLVPEVGMITSELEKANILNEHFFSNFNHTYTLQLTAPGLIFPRLHQPSLRNSSSVMSRYSVSYPL